MEDERAEEVKKELSYFSSGVSLESLDPKSSELKFMYNVPRSIANTGAQEDEAVKCFKRQFDRKGKGLDSPGKLTSAEDESSIGIVMCEKRNTEAPSFELHGIFSKSASKKAKGVYNEDEDIQCVRCGLWGHSRGDPTCSLSDSNPHVFARENHKDAEAYLKSKEFFVDKQKMVLRHASEFSLGTAQDRDEDSDPEADFIATLTTREKKLLLRRLSRQSS